MDSKEIKKELERIEKEFTQKVDLLRLEHKKKIQAILDRIEMRKLKD